MLSRLPSAFLEAGSDFFFSLRLCSNLSALISLIRTATSSTRICVSTAARGNSKCIHSSLGYSGSILARRTRYNSSMFCSFERCRICSEESSALIRLRSNSAASLSRAARSRCSFFSSISLSLRIILSIGSRFLALPPWPPPPTPIPPPPLTTPAPAPGPTS